MANNSLFKNIICLYRCSVNVLQCHILYLQVQIHNYIHTTRGCLFKTCMHMFIFFSENYVRLVDLLLSFGEAFSMGFIYAISQCKFIFVSFLSSTFPQSLKKHENILLCKKGDFALFYSILFFQEIKPNSFVFWWMSWKVQGINTSYKYLFFHIIISIWVWCMVCNCCSYHNSNFLDLTALFPEYGLWPVNEEICGTLKGQWGRKDILYVCWGSWPVDSWHK